MNTFWVLILLLDDGSGQFKYTQHHSQYLTRAECVAQRNEINQSMTNVRAECYALKATKEK